MQRLVGESSFQRHRWVGQQLSYIRVVIDHRYRVRGLRTRYKTESQERKSEDGQRLRAMGGLNINDECMA
jgi:hypothetical protein